MHAILQLKNSQVGVELVESNEAAAKVGLGGVGGPVYLGVGVVQTPELVHLQWSLRQQLDGVVKLFPLVDCQSPVFLANDGRREGLALFAQF